MSPWDPRAAIFAKHAQHVVIIHFPIALFIAGVAFDFIATRTRRKDLVLVAYYNFCGALLAAVPAVCEELAFRGFILSGCRKLGNNGRAIFVSAILFGVTHGFLQQSINACLLGIVLGYLAVRSGSLLPGVIFHFLHNAMTVLSAKVTPELIDRFPGLGFLVQPGGDGPAYQWPVYLFGGLTSLAVLGWFTWFPEARSPEDLLQEVFVQSAEDSMSDDNVNATTGLAPVER